MKTVLFSCREGGDSLYPVSNAFFQKIKENTREYYWAGSITTKHGTRYTFESADILKGSAYINHKSCSSDEMEIGSVNAAEMKITLFNNIDRYTLGTADKGFDEWYGDLLHIHG